MSIWPGIVIASVAYDAPDNDGTRHYEYAFIGVGETNFVQFASYSFNYNAGVQPPPTTYVPGLSGHFSLSMGLASMVST